MTNAEGSAQQEQLKFLLADFTATKSEIARRSSLQRVVLAVYVAALAVVFREVVTSHASAIWLLAVWAAAALAFQFYAREGLEIMRLSRIIRDRTAHKAAALIGCQKEDLLPSETDPEVPQTLPRRISYDRSFNWALFCGAPAALSAIFIAKRAQELIAVSRCSSAILAGTLLIGCAIAARCALLLVRHASHAASQDV